MAPTQRFVNYPVPREGPDVPYKPEKDSNPIFRGIPLTIMSNIIVSSTFLQKWFAKNAGFEKSKDIPGLEGHDWRFFPIVTPIADSGASTEAVFGPELYERQTADAPGRFASVADFHELYKTKKLTPTQVVEALLPLIRRSSEPKGKYSSAWVDSHEEQILAAAKASTKRWAAGTPLGLMDGVPFGVKDDIDVEGYVTNNGMKYDPSAPSFRPPKETEWPVRQLEAAGGIMIGKNTMHELGLDTCGCNPRWGTPVNWYNPEYYPGGSSSGAGSALGAGLVPISIGTDAAGSCRVPPTYNGVYGFKLSQSRSIHKISTVVTICPMASTVKDLTIAYRIMTRPNPDDPIQGAFALSIPPSPTAKKYLGVFNDWFNAADPVVVETCRKAIAYMTDKLGYEVVDIKIPYLREGQLAHSATCLFEAAEAAQRRTKRPEDYLTIMNHCSKVLTSVGSHLTAMNMTKNAQLRGLIMEHMAFLFEKYPGLLVVTPSLPEAGWRKMPGDETYGFSDGNRSVRAMMYMWLSNSTGCPALTAPVGYVDPEAGEGKLPVGLMAMGEWGAEEQLLAWAKDAETYLNDVYPGGRLKPKEWADVIGLATQTGENGS